MCEMGKNYPDNHIFFLENDHIPTITMPVLGEGVTVVVGGLLIYVIILTLGVSRQCCSVKHIA